MSAPGIARITGFENGVWTVPPAKELTTEGILRRLAPWATFQTGDPIVIDGIDLTKTNAWGDCLHKVLVDTIAHIHTLEAENQDLRTDITIMGNVLDDYAGRR